MKRCLFAIAFLMIALSLYAQSISWSDFDDDFWDSSHKSEFDLHWAGFEMGMNNFFDENFNISRSTDDMFMNLNSSKSWNVNLNVIDLELNLISQKFGVGTGVGFEFNDYRFSNRLPIDASEGQIVVDSAFVASGINVEKAKLSTSFVTLPVLFEYQTLVEGNKEFFVSAGIIGGVRIGSHTKVVYTDDGSDRKKDKDRGSFFIPRIRYGYTVRIGYGILNLFATYYQTPLFENDKGPELYPFTIGFSANF